MGAPRLSPDEETARSSIVEGLDNAVLREDAALERVAEAAAAICGVPAAHVSLMESERQCVIGRVGFELDSFDRDISFCAHTIAEGEVLVVEDATDDERFDDNPFVVADPGLSFYVGLPIIVDDVPVGTMCAVHTEPTDIELQCRGELFGLINALESHLDVVYRHGNETPQHGIASKLTAIRALSAKERFRNGESTELVESLRKLEAETKEAFDMLAETPGGQEVSLDSASVGVSLEEDGE